jgi:hypothetical protein
MPKDYQEINKIVEELNGKRIVQDNETINVYKGEIVLPLSEFKKALTTYGNARVEEIIKIAEGMKLTKEDYQSSDFVNYPSFCGHMNGHNQTLTDLIKAIKK